MHLVHTIRLSSDQHITEKKKERNKVEKKGSWAFETGHSGAETTGEGNIQETPGRFHFIRHFY